MDNPTILVADGDPKNLQILRESLEASGFEVIVASDGLQAWQKISSDVPDLILSEVNLPKLDGFQLLEKLKADPVTSAIPLMFLTNRRELQDRVRSLRGGVKDYMIKPLHVKEVIARVRMILRRMERIREEEIESTRKLAGRLEEFSVIDLIENFGMERKTGILTLYNANNRSGEIYFRDGAVINASLGNLKAEKAVYQMLPWKRGHFTMTFKEINVPDEIAVSNLGLLLQGFKRMEERERMFKMLPSPETSFVTTETFRNIITKRELTSDVAKFISLIDGKRDILQIIDESSYDDIKTLERLVKLYQQGFIKPNKTSIAGDEEMSDMVSTIAEPKIVEKLDLSSGLEQRFAARTTDKEAPMAFRSPDGNSFTPSERATKTSETKRDLPAAPRETKSPLEPAGTKTPPPPPIAVDLPEATPIELEPFGEDALPEEQPWPVKAREDRPESGKRMAAPPVPPNDETVDSEPLPIDLHDLLQRPTAPPPIFDKPAEPRQTTPLAYEPPKSSPLRVEPEKVEAKTEKTEEIPAIFKMRDDKSVPPAPPSILEILDELIPATGDDSASSHEETPSPEIAKKFGKAVTQPSSETAPRIPAIPPAKEPLGPEFGPKIAEPPFEAAPPPPVAANEPIPAEPMTPSPVVSLIERPTTPEVPPVTPKVIEPLEMRSEPLVPVTPEKKPSPAEPSMPATSLPEILEPVQLREKPVVQRPVTPPVVAPEPMLIEPAAPPIVSPAPTAPPSDTILSCLMQLLKSRPAAKPKLVIIGREGIQISPVVRHLLGPESSLRRLQSAVFQYLEIGERKVESQPFEIIGISMEQQFTRLLDTADADLIGYVVIVEAYRKEGIEYLSYLLNMLKNVYRRPLGVAVVKAADQKNMSIDTLRDLLNLAPSDLIQECTPTDKASVTEFLKGFTSEANLQRWNVVGPAK